MFALSTDSVDKLSRCRIQSKIGIGYCHVSSYVTRISSFRLFLALSILLGLILYQGDINTAYLDAILTIKYYNVQGFRMSPDESFLVNKALYGLRQAGLEWYEKFGYFLKTNKFKQSSFEPCFYTYQDG